MTEARMHRTALAVDLDHTLAALLPAAVDWYNTQQPDDDTKATVALHEVTITNWIDKLMGPSDAMEANLQAFFASLNDQPSNVEVLDTTARDVLKRLRPYFTMFVLTDRPRVAEKLTREWLDVHFAGVFDKLLFIDVDAHDNMDQVVQRKQEILHEFKVKVAIGADAAMMDAMLDEVEHAVVVSDKASTTQSATKVVTVADWMVAEPVFQAVVKTMELKTADKVVNGPKLSRYTDDLVTVSARKSAAFYASMVHAKFVVQKQKVIRLQAADRAITTAVQTAEMVKKQQTACVTKIQTQYLKRFHDGESRREPTIEIELSKLPQAA